jgi:GT2 family glycosyltransferase
MKLSIVIPCWLRNAELVQLFNNCVKSVEEWTKDYELILVDNGSEHGQGCIMANADVYIRNKQNLGYAPAVNQGFRLAKGEYVAIMNDDLEVYKDWDTNLMGCCKNGISFPRPLPDHLPLSTPQDNLAKWHANTRDDERVDMGFGGLYVARRDVFASLAYPDGSLLDEGFKMGMFEDTDLWQRANHANRPLTYSGTTFVWHKESATWNTLEDKKELFEANEKRYKDKWGV